MGTSMEDIANRIRIKRVEKRLSFQDLADKTHMSKSTLQRYESGAIKNIPLDKLEILASALDVTPEWIMGWTNDTKKMAGVVDRMDQIVRSTYGDENVKRLKVASKPIDGEHSISMTLLDITKEEHALLLAFWKLSPEGRSEAIKRIKELGELENYVPKGLRDIQQEEDYINHSLLPLYSD